jgi:hypothetical protein
MLKNKKYSPGFQWYRQREMGTEWRGDVMNKVLERCKILCSLPPHRTHSASTGWLIIGKHSSEFSYWNTEREEDKEKKGLIQCRKRGKIGGQKGKNTVEAFVGTVTAAAIDTVCPLKEVVSTAIPFPDLNHARGFNYFPLYLRLKSLFPLHPS